MTCMYVLTGIAQTSSPHLTVFRWSDWRFPRSLVVSFIKNIQWSKNCPEITKIMHVVNDLNKLPFYGYRRGLNNHIPHIFGQFM